MIIDFFCTTTAALAPAVALGLRGTPRIDFRQLVVGNRKQLRPSTHASVWADFEAELVEFDGEDDHVHLLVNNPPSLRPSFFRQTLTFSLGFQVLKASPYLLIYE